MAHHRTTMSTNAQPYRPAPKKIGVQAALSRSWIAYGSSAALAPTRRQASQPERAIIAYRMVQTGPNSQDGGAHAGRSRLAYSLAVPLTASAPNVAAAVTASPNAASPAQRTTGERGGRTVSVVIPA